MTNSSNHHHEHGMQNGCSPNKSIYKKSPEIHDLMRFRNAVMQKYVQTHDTHFKNMANALTPQIEAKIREFNRTNGI